MAGERWSAYLSAAGSTAAVVPLVEGLCARIGNLELEAMQSDAARWVSSLNGLRKLLEVDALVIGVDTTMAAEACGHPVEWLDGRPVLSSSSAWQVGNSAASAGRQATATDVLNRFCQAGKAVTGGVAMMTGPLALAQQLYSNAENQLADVKPLIVELAEQLCQARPDLLLLREGATLGQGDITMAQRKVFNTLKNVAAYFDVPVGLYLDDYAPERIAQFEKLKLPFLWLGRDAGGCLVAPETAREISSMYSGLGLPIEFANPDLAWEQAMAYAEALPGYNYLLTSTGDIDPDSDLEALIALTRKLHE